MKKTVPKNAILIPDNAERVFSGAIFDVYQWPQTMFDGSTKTFEMLKRPDTVQIIAVKEGKLVLVDDEQPGRTPRLHFPGGRADNDDSWLSAAQREMREETGLVFKDWKLVNVVQPIPKIEWFAPWFLAINFEHEVAQEVDSDGEKITVSLKDFAEVRGMILSGSEPTMQYALPLFNTIASLDQLLAMSVFVGQEVDR